MIGRLRGELVARDGGRGVIEVGGVGYEVLAPARALDGWAGEDEILAHVSTQVREDAITLYAFDDLDDRAVFNALLGVSGVGPRIALACLDTLSASATVAAIGGGDTRALGKVPGIGKKLAQRLCLELKDKLPVVSFHPAIAGAASAPPPRAPARPADDLAAALGNLGYSRAEIERVAAHLAETGAAELPIAERLRAALSYLYAR